jgi:hypothetical protein
MTLQPSLASHDFSQPGRWRSAGRKSKNGFSSRQLAGIFEAARETASLDICHWLSVFTISIFPVFPLFPSAHRMEK